ncbi:MAG: ABC-F family ATP-binding cassette domain-containing protein [Candidatus Wallbacteria bacterium]|nr:ABC-F family ATP-binding cassette domain-containing protein [Candidatus Wallbacteria bacterium]
MIHINGLRKRYGDKLLFENLDLHIRPRERMALAGENGSGKTTLMRIISGMEEEDAGTVNKAGHVRTGYLPQFLHTGYDGQVTLYDEVRKAFGKIYAKADRMRELEFSMGEDLSPEEFEKVSTRYSDLLEELTQDGYYELDARIKIVLFGLGFTESDLEKKCTDFSGGWQMRIYLARILIEQPEVLLLDEPTNHLDIESCNWLEEFIRGYPGAVVLVSHDRYFLDSTVTRVAELYAGELRCYTGNFTKFEEMRELYIDDLHKKADQYEQTVEKAERFITRFRAKNTKSTQVQSRVKMLARIEEVKIPPKRRTIRFRFPRAPHSGHRVLRVTDAGKQYGSNIVFMGAEFEVERGERVAVLGKNGAGKTTLIKIIAGVVTADSGTMELGHNVTMDYYAQEPSEVLNHDRTVYEELYGEAEDYQVPEIRSILGAFLFCDDDVHKKVKVLSGGERSRLALARMLLRKSNLLILDEPTNHLDIYSKDVLMDALKYFEGTIIFVSHDRWFIDQLATKVIYIQDGEAGSYNGGYEDFLRNRARREQEERELRAGSDSRERKKKNDR